MGIDRIWWGLSGSVGIYWDLVGYGRDMAGIWHSCGQITCESKSKTNAIATEFSTMSYAIESQNQWEEQY